VTDCFHAQVIVGDRIPEVETGLSATKVEVSAVQAMNADYSVGDSKH
jgi:hypothetical protein